jgi:hypothetical protein
LRRFPAGPHSVVAAVRLSIRNAGRSRQRKEQEMIHRTARTRTEQLVKLAVQ